MQAILTGTAPLAGRKSVFDAFGADPKQTKHCPHCRAPIAPLSGTTSLYIAGANILPEPPLMAANTAELTERSAKSRFVRFASALWSAIRQALALDRQRELTQAEISRLPNGPLGPDYKDRVWVSAMPAHMLAAGARGEVAATPRQRSF